MNVGDVIALPVKPIGPFGDIVSVGKEDRVIGKTPGPNHAEVVCCALNDHDRLVADNTRMRQALERIVYVRDHLAEYGEYPVGTVNRGQCFDDWAADQATAALKACEPQIGANSNVQA